MKKILIYAMEGENMCFMHALMNAKQLKENGHEVKIILEGQSVKLPKKFVENGNELFKSLKEDGTIVGACLACSKALGAYEDNKEVGIELLDDMDGHAGILKYVEEDYEILVF